MSQENVEVVRSIYADWQRGDFSSSDWAHPEIEWVLADGPAPGSWMGLVGMAEGWRNVLDAFEGLRPDADEYRELDGERVLVLFQYSGRGKASGLEVGQIRAKGAQLVHLRGGKVTRSVFYFDRSAALEAVGLSE